MSKDYGEKPVEEINSESQSSNYSSSYGSDSNYSNNSFSNPEKKSLEKTVKKEEDGPLDIFIKGLLIFYGIGIAKGLFEAFIDVANDKNKKK